MAKKQLPTLDLDTLEAVSGGAMGRAFTLPNLQNVNIGQIAGAVSNLSHGFNLQSVEQLASGFGANGNLSSFFTQAQHGITQLEGMFQNGGGGGLGNLFNGFGGSGDGEG